MSLDFLYYWFEYIRPQVIRENKQGVTQVNLNTDIVRNLRVALPPSNEQRRIVARIEELFSDLDVGVAALERAKANLKRYRAAVLKAAVEGKLTEQWRVEHPDIEPASKLLERILAERRSKWEADQQAKFAAAGKQPPKNWKAKYVEPELPDQNRLPGFEPPRTWTWATVDSIAYVTKLAGFEYTKYVKYDAEGDLAVIKAENASKNGFRRTEFSRVRSASVRQLERSRLHGGELLMAFVGSVGQVAIVPSDQTYFLGPNIAMIRIQSPFAAPEYCEIFLRSAIGYTLALSFAKAVAQPSLSMGTIRQIPVLIPPMREQHHVVLEVDARLSQIDAMEVCITQGLVRAARLRQSILKRAFEGKLVPQDTNDEPASVLLERIKAATSTEVERTPSKNSKPKAATRKPRKQKQR